MSSASFQGLRLLPSRDRHVPETLIGIQRNPRSPCPGISDRHASESPIAIPRITQYCNSFAGNTNPPASSEQIQCYIVRQLPGNPNTELTLPADISTYARYQIPYGQRGTFDGSNPVDYAITLPKRHYTGVALEALCENLGASNFTFSLDVGANGSAEWNGSGTDQPTLLSSPDLTNALNSFMNNAPGDWGDEVVVPIRMTLNTTGDVFLMNFNATPGGDGDLELGAGDLLVSDTTPATGQLLTLTATAHNNGNYTVENVIAAFFAGDPTEGGVYLGSGYLASLEPGESGQVSITWTTTGYTGPVDVYVMLDAAGQISELDENNNSVFVQVQFPNPPPPPGEERFLYLPIIVR